MKKLALAALSVGLGAERRPGASLRRTVGVVIADDETVRGLNARYRGLDEVTDVLAFSPVHGGYYEGEEAPSSGGPTAPFPLPEDVAEDLGEVIVAYAQAERQAAQEGHPVEQEVALLVVHGVLHLLGYDHAEPADERVMWELQRTALSLTPGP